MREVATPQYLRDQAVSVIDQSFDILGGRADSPAIFLNLAPIKTTLRGPPATTFAAALAARLPVCAAGEEALAPGASIVKCPTPGGSTEQTAALIAAGLPAYLDRLPDQVNIVGEDTGVAYRVLRLGWLGAGRLGLSLTVLLLGERRDPVNQAKTSMKDRWIGWKDFSRLPFGAGPLQLAAQTPRRKVMNHTPRCTMACPMLADYHPVAVGDQNKRLIET